MLWRDAGGHPVAASDRCPHRGTALSLGRVDARGCVVCPNHGWTYDASGACVRVPQLAEGVPADRRARLVLYSCEERYGLVWVCLGAPVADVPAFPEWSDPGYRHVACAPFTWRTSAARMVENVADPGRLGYVHDGLPRSRRELVVPAHRVEQVGDELRTTMTVRAPEPDGGRPVTALAGARCDDYVLTLPFTVHLASRDERDGSHRALFFAAQPHGDGACTGYCYRSRDFDLSAADEPYAQLQATLAERERPIVESQLPVELPPDPAAEIHMAFDRVAVAYRRALARLLDPVARTLPGGRRAPRPVP